MSADGLFSTRMPATQSNKLDPTNVKITLINVTLTNSVFVDRGHTVFATYRHIHFCA
jgi:hypothetical protein